MLCPLNFSRIYLWIQWYLYYNSPYSNLKSIFYKNILENQCHTKILKGLLRWFCAKSTSSPYKFEIDFQVPKIWREDFSGLYARQVGQVDATTTPNVQSWVRIQKTSFSLYVINAWIQILNFRIWVMIVDISSSLSIYFSNI